MVGSVGRRPSLRKTIPLKTKVFRIVPLMSGASPSSRTEPYCAVTLRVLKKSTNSCWLRILGIGAVSADFETPFAAACDSCAAVASSAFRELETESAMTRATADASPSAVIGMRRLLSSLITSASICRGSTLIGLPGWSAAKARTASWIARSNTPRCEATKRSARSDRV